MTPFFIHDHHTINLTNDKNESSPFHSPVRLLASLDQLIWVGVSKSKFVRQYMQIEGMILIIDVILLLPETMYNLEISSQLH